MPNVVSVEIPVVASNHADLREVVESCGLTFHHLPVAKADQIQQEARIRAFCEMCVE